MPRCLPPLLLLLVFLAAPSAAAACSGDPDQVQPLTLTVDGEPATGIFTLPSGPPRGLVVFGHGAANTVDAWRRHMSAVSRREGVIAVAMNYRGMRVTGRSAKHGTETARGYPAKKGSEDLVAAAQHFDSLCPDLPGIVLYGVSMGGTMTGLAAAANAERSDGRPLFDYWIVVEGVHNVTESYHQARTASVYVKFAAEVQEDVEAEMGGPFETRFPVYLERTNVNRTDDIASSGLRGVILVHAYEDGIVPYNQSVEMAHGLRAAGLPTDLYSVGRKGASEPDDTLGKYVGARTGNAGHGWEGSDTHIVVQSGFDRLSALITRGEPAPCNRDFRIDDTPSNISPDPREAPAGCKPDPLPPAADKGCREAGRPARPTIAIRRRGGRRVTLHGRGDRGCGRLARVRVAIGRRVSGKRCRFVKRRGALSAPRPCRRPLYARAEGRRAWRRPLSRPLPRGRYVVKAVSVGRDGRRSRVARASFAIR